ncbi:class D beta-lactamase [Wenzhouxiangella marina]|uniref:Beta-lactamase n=1 Tax=Wenzhouxiangella marina TaxID=1579979 RepID=A0A0K0XUL7_9GAMM|nr:class D beta-lactamase [Wenzhouxiangella marina]AKS41311.1 Beta-lactamase [Wenzhouxiangella marina]MBB6086939.1 beta-lactamase class D [Wenzhouxiangella marina]
MTKPTFLLLGAALLSLLDQTAIADEPWQARADWADLFNSRGVEGTLVVHDLRSDERWAHNPDRAATRFGPASTFKIPHMLFALDAGLVNDEFDHFEWDGVERVISAWNQDQTPRSSMRNSAVWVYQDFARALGEDRERDYLERIDYGNADPGGGIDRFWLDGELAISPIEQIDFLERLYRNELPFSEAHQRLVKDFIITAAGRHWILRAKTGWQVLEDRQYGWWVGWVEFPDGPVFFATHIDLPEGGQDAPKRQAITRAALELLGAWPDP